MRLLISIDLKLKQTLAEVSNGTSFFCDKKIQKSLLQRPL